MIKKILLSVIVLVVATVIIWQWSLEPSHNRDWSADQAILPKIDIDSNNRELTVHNIRSFNYRTTTDYDVVYRTDSFDLDDLTGVDYLVVPFDDKGAAHTMLSFSFDDGRYLAVSVEIRKTEGVIFSPWQGLFRQYEIMYVVADEEDVIKLRTDHRQEPVYLYPTVAGQEEAKELLLSIAKRVNSLAEEPEFYNTATNNCTTNIARHVNEVSQTKIPWWDPRLIAPASSDILAYKLGFLDIPESPRHIRDQYLINNLTQSAEASEDFSATIRSNIKQN